MGLTPDLMRPHKFRSPYQHLQYHRTQVNHILTGIAFQGGARLREEMRVKWLSLTDPRSAATTFALRSVPRPKIDGLHRSISHDICLAVSCDVLSVAIYPLRVYDTLNVVFQ